MCAQYDSETRIAVFQRFGLSWASTRLSECRSQMFPRYLGPVIRVRDGEPGLDAMIWTLIPRWAKSADWKNFRHNFNARAETIGSLPSFRTSLADRRCLVPAAAFFEYPRLEGRKVRHRIASADGGPMLFAGLWDRWSDGDIEITSFTVITVEPHPRLRWLHHRIPAILSEEGQEAWVSSWKSSGLARAFLASPDPDQLSIVPEDASPASRPLELGL